MPSKSLSPSEFKKAVESTAGLAKAKRLAPKARDYVAAFGPEGLKGDPKGKWEYHFPKSDDPEKQRQINEAVYDMQQPWRRASTGLSHERNAVSESVTLKDHEGRRKVVPAAHAERIARRRGLIPVWRAGGVRLIPDAEGYLWRDYGRGKLEPTGHTHLGEPWPSVRKTCRGCMASGG